jgi:hypothetical protein
MSYDSGLDESKPLGYAVAFLYSLVVAVLWIPAFVIRRIGRFVREAGVENWPRANGSITAGKVTVIHGWVVDYALGRLDYSYRVAGEYYAGSIARQFPDEQAAWDFVDARCGKTVVIRYKDDHAKLSALPDADQEPSWVDEPGPGLFAMIWQHWRDELRSEQPPVENNENEDLDLEDEDEKVNSEDLTHH